MQGGTFCNLYGYLAGLRKSLPEAKLYGMGYIHDYRFINSHGGHYSNITNLSLLGVDIQKRTIRIRMTTANDIDLRDLEEQMRACFSLHCVIPTILLTLGTTDTFAIDRVRPVYDLRERLCAHYEIPVRPHIHVDSAIGWSLLFFRGYDFERNPLKINPATLEGLRRNVERADELRYADSFTVDFQKWGYVPYTSSLVMFKDRRDLKALENAPENFSYFERDLQGQTHLQSTIECSRGAAGLFGAYAALRYLGVEGYRTVIAHCLQNANYFRQELGRLGFAKVLAAENQGPSVGFRLYDPEVVRDPEREFDYEYAIRDTEEYHRRLERNSRWHRAHFLSRGRSGLYTNWVEFIAHTDYDEKQRFHKLPGEKAVFMNPATSRAEIDAFIARLAAFTGSRPA
jgi:glutamate/tyrosine decarboxylase-like PLP-dependent enzyme